MAHQKNDDRDSSGPRLNDEIAAPMIRLVTDDGHNVLSRYAALARAKSLNMDLVEVDRQAKPPVCKIFDYHKHKYVHQAKEKERAKSKDTLKTGSCKEIRFTAKINQKDLQMKANLAKRLMESCYRVKCTAKDPTDDCDLATLLSRFRALTSTDGRLWVAHPYEGGILWVNPYEGGTIWVATHTKATSRLATLAHHQIKDFAVEESAPMVEKKQAFVVARHVKFGPAKTGSTKKPSKSGNQHLEENGSETEPVDHEEQLGEDVPVKKSEWSVLNGDNDDINTVFDIDEAIGQPESPIFEQRAAVTGNRYARDPAARKPSRNPTDVDGRGAIMNTVNSSTRVNITPHGQNVPAQTNRYKKNGPSDSGRNPTATDSRMNRGPGGGNNPREERRR
ncbi:hypothetical protein OROMI_033158 [Orobanche minor]